MVQLQNHSETILIPYMKNIENSLQNLGGCKVNYEWKNCIFLIKPYVGVTIIRREFKKIFFLTKRMPNFLIFKKCSAYKISDIDEVLK